MSYSAKTVQALTLPAADGYPIAAHLYPAHNSVKGQLIVAGATGWASSFIGVLLSTLVRKVLMC